ncbi:hypothetical protein A3A39_02630 [Candidatus Kaiserbacteria bacterium RIFCSPLOWO2_01_FULL_54_13]|uniref:Excinuclease ABC subunit C n=1 Tax=Candidatus Kaiserbacteria bacterium RIFCSPLOWO2_01_FULL_54_13 TaxID=1798512 RepID=A0A1F6F3H7_9BACT|nr:MAG: hypothetical protein A3A39_02630 [Candidatus Kaiserbacteria bacterium RIFCSPLOWO2_01_FULL_54_13]
MKREELRKYKLPDGPGVYLFKKGRKILYIGKAASLRDRVRSYFAADLVEGRGSRIVGMVSQASTLSWKKTDSVLEALILEANLIKRHQPLFNVDQKDNKSWNYVVVMKETFPRVLLVRGRELFSGSLQARSSKLAATFGPYPHGGQLQEAMKIIRRIFPFRDSKCIPCDEQLRKKLLVANLRKLANSGEGIRGCNPCFNRQIGLCPGVCTGEVSREEYARTIRNIIDLFSGKFKGLKRRLTREMRAAAKREDFEEAQKLRRQISALEHIRDVSLIKNEKLVSSGGPSMGLRASGTRIEAYDVAHTAGAETVAVMTVVDSGESMKAAYRKFKIRGAKNNDVAALKEALERRLGHPEWPLPRVFVVDGGKSQVRTAERVLKNVGVMVPVVGVVKNEFHKPKRLIGEKRAVQAFERDILLANSEAHRFAITWHRKQLRQRWL